MAEESKGWIRLLRWAIRAFSASVLVLLLSGTYLLLASRSVASQAFEDLTQLQDGFDIQFLVQDLHRLTAWLLLLTASAAAVLALLDKLAVQAIPAGVALVAGLVALLTGIVLPWDQVALWSQAGTGLFGLGSPVGDDVQFVLLGGTEVSRAQLRWIFFGHLGAAAAAAIAALRANTT